MHIKCLIFIAKGAIIIVVKSMEGLVDAVNIGVEIGRGTLVDYSGAVGVLLRENIVFAN